MAGELKSVYEFDMVFDGQKVFRAVLNALANPGITQDIREQAGKFGGEYKALVALGAMLLDNEEKMYVEKNRELSMELHNLTLCRESELGRADYVFLSSELNYGSMEQILKNSKHGTYADPHDSVTILILCHSLDGDEDICLEGPGINKELTRKVYPYIKKVIEIRDSLDIEYPLGVDLIFTDGAGNLMGVPRLVKIKR